MCEDGDLGWQAAYTSPWDKSPLIMKLVQMKTYMRGRGITLFEHLYLAVSLDEDSSPGLYNDVENISHFWLM